MNGKKIFFRCVIGVSLTGVLIGIGCLLQSFLFPSWASMPFVKINETVFVFDGNMLGVDALPDDYINIDEIEVIVNTTENRGKTVASIGEIGNKIYQSPNTPNELYLYTSWHSGRKSPRFLRFYVKNN